MKLLSEPFSARSWICDPVLHSGYQRSKSPATTTSHKSRVLPLHYAPQYGWRDSGDPGYQTFTRCKSDEPPKLDSMIHGI
jgi:hypothetical protein